MTKASLAGSGARGAVRWALCHGWSLLLHSAAGAAAVSSQPREWAAVVCDSDEVCSCQLLFCENRGFVSGGLCSFM